MTEIGVCMGPQMRHLSSVSSAWLNLPLMLLVVGCSTGEASSVAKTSHRGPTKAAATEAGVGIPAVGDVDVTVTDGGSDDPETDGGSDDPELDLSSAQPPLRLSTCGQVVLEFAYLSPEACTSSAFRCPPGRAAFFNECGCGCRERPAGAQVVDDALQAQTEAVRRLGCGGVVGELLLLDEPFHDLVVDAAFVHLQTAQRWWSVDKMTALLTPHPVDVMPDLSQAQPLTPADPTQLERLGSVLESEELAAIVVERELYAVSDRGRLWFADLSSAQTEPRQLERHGAYDDDDYDSHIGTDADAVYWQAGLDFVSRTSDGAPLALYRTCRVGGSGR